MGPDFHNQILGQEGKVLDLRFEESSDDNVGGCFAMVVARSEIAIQQHLPIGAFDVEEQWFNFQRGIERDADCCLAADGNESRTCDSSVNWRGVETFTTDREHVGAVVESIFGGRQHGQVDREASISVGHRIWHETGRHQHGGHDLGTYRVDPDQAVWQFDTLADLHVVAVEMVGASMAQAPEATPHDQHGHDPHQHTGSDRWP